VDADGGFPQDGQHLGGSGAKQAEPTGHDQQDPEFQVECIQFA
jgi:hypothetical protein